MEEHVDIVCLLYHRFLTTNLFNVYILYISNLFYKDTLNCVGNVWPQETGGFYGSAFYMKLVNV